MSYNSGNVERIREYYNTKHIAAEEAASLRQKEASLKIPGLRDIDRRLAMTGPRLMAIALHKSGETVEDVKNDVTSLRAEHERLLNEYGYPSDYTDPKYECALCSDSGYVGNRMCGCMREDIIKAGYESAGISKLMNTCSFVSFNLDYYKTSRDVYDNMSRVFSYVKAYAETFDTSSDSLIFFGNTGLGKTHLSVALAKRVTERGFDVVYTGAIGMFGDYEQARFKTASGTESGNTTDRYYNCELLIIDDLGAEISNQFTVSTLYDLLNRRINNALPTVISTNLNYKELSARYTDRIASRIFGGFASLMFTGTDIRMQKLAGGR
ncbi:MAG: ATP-binding protein [Clostridia bacterium]|nr:ATP-binding protein [Clostridia bacterium]